MGMAASEDEDSVPFADDDIVAYEDVEIEASDGEVAAAYGNAETVACEYVVTAPSEGEDSVAFDTETEASDEASEPCKVNAEPDEDEDTPYADAEPCVAMAAYEDEATVAPGDKENAASEDMETEQLEVTDAEPFEGVEPEPELQVVEPFEVTEPRAVIAELVVVKLGVIEKSAKVELLLKLQPLRMIEELLVQLLKTQQPLNESPWRPHRPQLTQPPYHSPPKQPSRLSQPFNVVKRS
ncbi:hypothetical protein FocnCong_v003867 [Fusarium oxysporum f. sp. conglutinans]|nr:hypothetical protein FocnCong_v003867 [Fusarium oxysporum f. sp. conglutinans]